MPTTHEPDSTAEFHHVDVFSASAYAGNSLAVFVDPPPLTTSQLRRITGELRHFETIFVSTGADTVHARVFDLLDELDFAGHPVLGAAAVLHGLGGTPPGVERRWTFTLAAGTVSVSTRGHAGGHVSALLDQGRPELVSEPAPADLPAIAEALGLTSADLDPALPPEVLSTGLRYLVVPVRDGAALAAARISHPAFDRFLAGLGAQFAYVLDAAAVEGRHWNNDGVLEDVATGSAAGCVAAYLLRHGRASHGVELSLAQGRFVGRPSRIAITAYGKPELVERVTVGGDVTVVGTGRLLTLPAGEGL
ncbi:phenazine biosynthesis protein PhzF family [Amycolatopsis xylanica]|uniref:Phenazine biosynthesis protein PhzF family n=1 Tax=Amycolatopsis xylanica TaxID=589385 RepID=A0A1H3S8K5_9PSEU|nr:PhzF family phenazine biosynthesis protein [Amycolatopsis xylanica]SDZ33915.1 phenazine biosynthesis protein PhzF family [Amycolatopsis xylanica]